MFVISVDTSGIRVLNTLIRSGKAVIILLRLSKTYKFPT